MSSARGSARRPIDCVVPLNWMMISLAAPREPQVIQAVRRLTAELGQSDEARAVREGLQEELAARLAELHAAGGVLYLLEVDPVAGYRTGTRLALTPMPVAQGDDPLDYLLALAARTPGAQVMQSGSLVALRTVTQADVTAGVATGLASMESIAPTLTTGVDLSGHSLVRMEAQYYLGYPEHPQDWYIAVAHVTVPGGDEGRELGKALLRTCDSIVKSVRVR